LPSWQRFKRDTVCHGIAVHDRLVEEHPGEQGLVETGLKFIRDDQPGIRAAREGGGFKCKACMATGVMADFLQHQAARADRRHFGRERRQPRRDQVGVHKHRAIRLVRQVLPRHSARQ
jgi:hypothetical protein